mgnify:CR=1 FL=1
MKPFRTGRSNPLKHLLLITSLLLANLLLISQATASELQLEEGIREMTTQGMKMEGMSEGMPPMTHRQCINKEQMVPTQ